MKCAAREFCARRRAGGGFTMVEVLVAAALVVVLMTILVSITNATSGVWRRTTMRVEQFRGGRQAFEAITRRLSQATLNTYWDYERDSKGDPVRYVRQSELRFLSGPAKDLFGTTSPARPGHAIFFQAPLGVADRPDSLSEPNYSDFENLVNTCGFFIEFGPEERPAFITEAMMPSRYRYRLKEVVEASQFLALYKYTSGTDALGMPRNAGYSGREWFREPLARRPAPVHTRAENVIALTFLPQLAAQEDPTGVKLAPGFLYDSTATKPDPKINPRNQLPPLVQVMMVALAENSAQRMDEGGKVPPVWLDEALGKLFTDPLKFADDRKTLEDLLGARRADYRIFTTTVPLKGAKWSTEQ